MRLPIKIPWFILPKPAAIYLLALAGCLALGSCKSNLQASQQQQPDTGTPLLHFQKTRCFGECPAYEATIHTNGSVTFIGKAHVPVQDTLTFVLSADELSDLNESINNLFYTSLQDLYPTQWSDMPATLLTFYTEGKEVKRIKHFEGGPDSLLKFQQTVHTLIWRHLTALKGN